ncbi:hypothetical protein RB195_000042 [Necator americanus]|uniref:Uncharacterized protein n=1 Tax=Necator americanus TaxID=51031 RepID=A0ABR1D964_NECAM
MSGGGVEQAISRTSVHEDIIREVEETDWTVDPVEEEDVLSCATANEANSKEDVANNGHDVESEDEDIEFDPDELECVDEDAEEERKEREERIRDRRRRTERYKYEDKKHHHSDARSRHIVERHHPYSRHERGRNFGGAHEIERVDRHRIEPFRLRRPFNHKPRRVESYLRKRRRSSSSDRSTKERRNGDEGDVPLEDLELEEVDCYDDVGDDGSEFTDGASGADESHGEDEDLDDVSMSRSRGPNHVSSVDGDDFPDLCEEIDEDAMRRAAAAAAVKTIVLPQSLSAKVISSPPVKTEGTVAKSRETSPYRRDSSSRKMGNSTFLWHHRSKRNGERHDDEARRRHQYQERNGNRSKREDRMHADKEKKDRVRENRDDSSVHRTYTAAKLVATEMCRNDDTELISVKGPLAHGWCSVDDEELPSTSSASPKSSNAVDDSRKGGSLRRCSFGTVENTATEVRYTSSMVTSPIRNNESSSKSAGRKHSTSPPNSPRKKDYGLHGLPRDYCSSPKSRTSEHHHQHQQLHAGRSTAILGSTSIGKIPSLLDICIKEPMDLQQPSTVLSGIGSRVRMDGGNVHVQRREADADNEKPKSRSLLDLDIPPPDRKMMRQYAIVLNSLELTQRPSRIRAERRSLDVPTKIQRLSTPRTNDHSERSRQPRSYVRGVRKISQ